VFSSDFERKETMAKKEKQKSTFSKPARALALALAILVSSGVVVYLVTFILSLFGINVM